MARPARWAILCIGFDGEQEYVMVGPSPGRVAIFHNKREAQENADFLKEGVAEDYQSINVVRAPKG